MDESPRGYAYRIHTERLVIRCWDPMDAPLLKEAIDASLDHLRPWMPWAYDEPESLQQKSDRLRKFRGKFDLELDFYYGIFNQDESKVIGATGLHTRRGANAFEVGYWICKDCTQRGYATESTAAMVKVAFEIGQVQRVEIRCDPRNIKSAAIPEKLSFRNEGVLRNRKPFRGGEFRDEMIWTLFVEEYPASPASQAQIEAFDVLGNRLAV
jgi:RimJ/RimL family protein N-acetyltransferase